MLRSSSTPRRSALPPMTFSAAGCSALLATGEKQLTSLLLEMRGQSSPSGLDTTTSPLLRLPTLCTLAAASLTPPAIVPTTLTAGERSLETIMRGQ